MWKSAHSISWRICNIAWKASKKIFEDLDAVRAMRQHGRFVFLDMEVTTSARRFREVGAVRQQLRNLALWTAWNVGVSPSRLKRFYSDHDRG